MVRDSSPELIFGDEDGETFSVSEFVKTVNQSIKQRFGRGVWLHGEIQELKTPSHVYFTRRSRWRQESRLECVNLAGCLLGNEGKTC